MRYRFLFSLPALALCLAGFVPGPFAGNPAGRAQDQKQPPAAQSGTIRISTGLVLIPVSVTDASGQAVS